MKNKPIFPKIKIHFWLIILVLIIAALACGGGGENNNNPNETNEEVPEPLVEEDNTGNNDNDSLAAEPMEEPEEPSATTGTIHGVVEFTNINTEPLPDTIVEVAGWEDIHWAKTNNQGEYTIQDVPPGIHMVIPRTNFGLISYQSVNVVAGVATEANFNVLSASPYVITNTIDATILVDGTPVEGAYLWVARSNEVYVSDQNGQLSFVYGSAVDSPIIAVHNDRWTIQKVPSGVENWEIELSHGGVAPPLPDNMVVIETQEPVSIFTIIPTPFPLQIIVGILVQEDCISFQRERAAVEFVSGSWKIVVGDLWLLDFGNNQSEAEMSLNIIRHYGLNQQCFVGRPDPSMEYYLINGEPPVGAFSGEDCVGFNPDALNTEIVNGRWKITEGSHLLMDFDDQEAEANNALSIIQKYNFTKYCFVGRPDPSLSYFRK